MFVVIIQAVDPSPIAAMPRWRVLGHTVFVEAADAQEVCDAIDPARFSAKVEALVDVSGGPLPPQEAAS